MSGPAFDAAAMRRADLCSSTDRVSILTVTPGLAASNSEKICFKALSSAGPFVLVQMTSSSAPALGVMNVERTPTAAIPNINARIHSSSELLIAPSPARNASSHLCLQCKPSIHAALHLIEYDGGDDDDPLDHHLPERTDSEHDQAVRQNTDD